jgi:curved DNA-binding protein CbpA
LQPPPTRRRGALRARRTGKGDGLDLTDAFLLFRRLGVDVQSLSPPEFTLAYYRLAKRYHPDRGNRRSEELMASINAARTVIEKARRAPC